MTKTGVNLERVRLVLFSILFTALSLALLWGGFKIAGDSWRAIAQRRNLHRIGERATGSVVRGRSESGKGGTWYSYTISFSTRKDQRIIFEDTQPHRVSPSLNETVTVLYDPAEPRQAVVEPDPGSDKWILCGGLFMLLAGLGFGLVPAMCLLLGLLWLFNAKKAPAPGRGPRPAP
jgi:hypothetical protein